MAIFNDIGDDILQKIQSGELLFAVQHLYYPGKTMQYIQLMLFAAPFQSGDSSLEYWPWFMKEAE